MNQMGCLLILVLLFVRVHPIPEKDQLAKSSWQTNYGTLTIQRGVIRLDGPIWTADGKFLRDGAILLSWEQRKSGQMGFGLYRWDECGWRGTWGVDSVFCTHTEKILPKPRGFLMNDFIRITP